MTRGPSVAAFVGRWVALSAWLPMAAGAADAQPVRLVEHMVLTESVAYHDTSPEMILSLEHVGPDGMRWKVESEVSKADQSRHVSGYGKSGVDSADDLKSSHRLFMRFFGDESEPQVGATIEMASSEVFAELRSKGETAIDVIEIPPAKGDVYDPDSVAMRKNFRGTLTRVGLENMRVVVNGVPLDLPVIHAKGVLKARELAHTFEFWWLDDPVARLRLRYRFEDFTERRVVRIDLPPEHSNVDAALSASLTKSCRAEVSGIYFASGSADLLTASRPALASVAGLLKSHPDWSITIEGHTDNVGNDAANLLLSRNRALAVKAELVAQHGVPASRIKTDGFGRKRPVDSNDSVEGRAHNRRVEVTRTC